MGKRSIVAVIVAAALLVPAAVLAQVCNFDMMYDPRSVTTISGTVLATIDYNPGNPTAGPQSVLITSDDQVYNVFLGPGWFLQQSGISLNKGDAVTVTGSLRNIQGRTYVVASSLSTPSRTFSIRSASGTPLYSMPPVVVSPPPVGRGPAAGPLVPFNPANIVTVTGSIRAVKEMATAESNMPIVVVALKGKDIIAPNNEIQVLLGPRAYLEQNGISLGHRQWLRVTGSEVLLGRTRTLVATSVVQGPNVVDLRTATGSPLFPMAATSSQTAPM